MQAERPKPPTTAGRPNTVPWPPLIYLAAALLGYALHLALPLPWLSSSAATAATWLGGAMGLAALANDVWAAMTFRKHRTTILPNRGATNLITTGPFAWSRNPIYVGNTALLFGAGLFFGVAWFCAAALAAAFVTRKLAIEREEAHLEEKFGEEWVNYAARVPRWLI